MPMTLVTPRVSWPHSDDNYLVVRVLVVVVVLVMVVLLRQRYQIFDNHHRFDVDGI